MSPLVVVVHLTGDVDVVLAPGADDPTALTAYRDDLSSALTSLRAAAATHAPTVPVQAQSDAAVGREPAPKRGRGRPRGSATGYDRATVLAKLREGRSLRNQGLSQAAVAARLGISPETLRRWERDYGAA